MTELANRLVTADDLFAMGEGRRVLIDGEVIEMTPPGMRHGKIVARLSAKLITAVEARGLNVDVVVEAGYRLAKDPDTVLAPDVSVVATPSDGSNLPTGYHDGPPCLAIEVTSPSQSFSFMTAKARQWVAAGTALVWVVDPEFKHVWVFAPGQPPRDLGPEDDLSADPVIPGFSLPVSELFR